MEISIKMKNYLHKATFLIIIYSLIAMLLNLGSMAYLKHLNDYKAFPALSQDYAIGSLTSAEDDDLRQLLLNGVDGIGHPHLLATELVGIDSFAIYYTDQDCFQLELEKGRLFSQQDFSTGKNLVLVNNQTESQCIEKDGAVYWDYGGIDFQVIGVYSDIDEFGNNTPNCYISFCASALDSSAFGGFLYDAGKNTENDLAAIKENIENKSPWNVFDYASASSAEAEEFSVSGNNFNSMFAIFVLTVLLILFNSISAVYNWVAVRKHEIAVRELVGASKGGIYLWLAKGITLLILISFSIGCLASKIFLSAGLVLPTRESVQLMFGVHLQPACFLCGFVLILFLCGITAMCTIAHFHKNEIARILR